LECGGRASRLYGQVEISLRAVERLCADGNLPVRTARKIVDEVLDALSRWDVFADEAKVRASRRKEIARQLARDSSGLRS
jgi:hypothetical protein